MLHEIFGGRPLDEVRASELAPPPYSKEGDYERLPSYPGHPDDEPATLARYLFIYGFFFPLFWLLGIAILCSPLETTPDWEQGKTEEEKKQLLSELRAAEVKWAKYCLWAFLSLSAIIATAVSFLFIVKLH
ncbi:hypothetical protein SERLA73DRAFT_61889 [Serpula lacrymans var. lacrymans S7.3]|uniref:Transmembrane protein n=2 Tax=Serpula lacrymans var. lacrymans TaxID=341189 RepID=F8QAB1_SERL3|nr:hypothetical protein SERLA73DRAFT_61889 [Serpula lacrymans var. lacrymans S7.3]